jgi:hypothetical protein
MTKQRYNVSDIAEILIEEIEAFKKSAELIKQSTEKLQQTEVGISEESLLALTTMLKENEKNQEKFATHLAVLTSKNSLRLPNWVFAMLLGFFLVLVGFSVYTMKKVENVKNLELEVEYYKSELEK